jgi:DnaJ-domain-containing protein 1
MALSFQIDLSPGKPGVLWALWRISSLRVHGILTFEWEKFKKQLVFRAGDPVASRSNWPHETLSSFLVRQKVVDGQKMKSLMSEQESQHKPLGELLVQQGVVPAAELGRYLELHFRERVFNLVALSHGRLQFTESTEVPLKDTDQIKLQEPLLRLAWEAARLHFDEGVCRSRLQTFSRSSLKSRGDFPFPISPKELRVWNQMQTTPKTLDQFEPEGLRLLAVAVEFQLIETGPSPEAERERDLKNFWKKIEKATWSEVLGLNVEASIDEVKKRYLEMVKQYHPDRLSSTVNPELKQLSDRVFARINEAYGHLTDPEKRQEYLASIELEKAGGMEQIEKSLQAEMLIPQARMAMKRRQFKSAAQALDQIKESLPQDAEILADWAYAHWMSLVEAKLPVKDKAAEFLGYYETALKKKPQYAAAHYYKGVVLKLTGDTNGALACFDEAIQLDSSLAEAASEARILRMRKEKDGKKSGFFKR